MRYCRRFLAGIPHWKAGHPCVAHPSATPSPSEEREDVRLACVRHAASVYPEPGSNSPSQEKTVRDSTHEEPRKRLFIGSVCDPGQAAVHVLSMTWLFADVAHLRSASTAERRKRPEGCVLTGTADWCAGRDTTLGRAFFALTKKQLLFCF